MPRVNLPPSLPINGRRFLQCLMLIALSVSMSCRPSTPAPADSPTQFTPVSEAHSLPTSISGVLRECSPFVKREFASACSKANIKWPPARITLLAFKQERVLEVWGSNATGALHLLARYPILAGSGGPGPKQKEGDRQVPEGIYGIDSLNPQSRFHLSLRVGYPNAFDVEHATVRRSEMGGDIYVHGNAVSIGCIAIGDPAIERIFTLVALADPSERRIVIAPSDLRTTQSEPASTVPWSKDLYTLLRKELKQYR
jgi:hypothetical protein